MGESRKPSQAEGSQRGQRELDELRQFVEKAEALTVPGGERGFGARSKQSKLDLKKQQIGAISLQSLLIDH